MTEPLSSQVARLRLQLREPLSSQVARLRLQLRDMTARFHTMKTRAYALRTILQRNLEPLIVPCVDEECARLEALQESGSLGIAAGDEIALARLVAVVVQDRLRIRFGIHVPDGALRLPDLTPPEAAIQ